jgi:hypothetical protein
MTPLAKVPGDEAREQARPFARTAEGRAMDRSQGGDHPVEGAGPSATEAHREGLIEDL